MTLDELIAKRDRFLEENPHLKADQRALDQVMEGMSPLERCAYLSRRMTQNLRALSEACKQLHK